MESTPLPGPRAKTEGSAGEAVTGVIARSGTARRTLRVLEVARPSLRPSGLLGADRKVSLALTHPLVHATIVGGNYYLPVRRNHGPNDGRLSSLPERE